MHGFVHFTWKSLKLFYLVIPGSTAGYSCIDKMRTSSHACGKGKFSSWQK